MTRQEYMNSISEEKDSVNQRHISNNHHFSNQNNNYYSNSNNAQGFANYSKDKVNAKEKSNCSSFNSAFRILNYNGNANKNVNEKTNTKTSPQESSSLLFKRQREDNNEEYIPKGKTQKKEENQEKKILNYNIPQSMPNEDISMRSYKSYLSNSDHKATMINNKNIKSLEEIKNDIKNKRKEAEKNIDAFKQNTFPIQNAKQSYEEKKKILIDYYNEKVKSLKDVTIMIEREKIKKESNFNHLKLSKNEVISLKGKEKVKPKQEIIKQTGLFIDNKGDKSQLEIKSGNNSMDNSNKDNNQKAHLSQDKKEIGSGFGLLRSISFGNNSIFDSQRNASGIENVFSDNKDNTKAKETEHAKEKVKEKSKQAENKLFSTDLFDNNKTSSIDFKPNPSDVGESSMKDSILGKIDPKETTKSSLFNFDLENTNAKDNKTNATTSNSNKLFLDFNGVGINNKDTKTNNQFPSITNTDNNKEISNLFDKKVKSPTKLNDTTIFKSNVQSTNDHKKETTNANPFNLTLTKFNTTNDNQIKQFLENKEVLQGSLMNDKNPFINTIKPDIINVFQSPAKQNASLPSLFQPQPQSGSIPSLFSPNKNSPRKINNSNPTPSLFAPNTFTNPITQGSNTLFGVTSKNPFA